MSRLRVQECNWLQAVEGEIDSAHAPLLHGRLDAQGTTSAWIQKRDLRPTFECVKQDFGMSIAARRNYDANTLYWRVNQFMLPFYTLVPPLSPFPDLSGHAWVPIDDENTLCIMFSYHPSEPLLPPRHGRSSRKGTRAARAGTPAATRSFKQPVTVPYAGLLDEVQSAERIPVRLRIPAHDMVGCPPVAKAAIPGGFRLADRMPRSGRSER